MIHAAASAGRYRAKAWPTNSNVYDNHLDSSTRRVRVEWQDTLATMRCWSNSQTGIVVTTNYISPMRSRRWSACYAGWLFGICWNNGWNNRYGNDLCYGQESLRGWQSICLSTDCPDVLLLCAVDKTFCIGSSREVAVAAAASFHWLIRFWCKWQWSLLTSAMRWQPRIKPLYTVLLYSLAVVPIILSGLQ